MKSHIAAPDYLNILDTAKQYTDIPAPVPEEVMAQFRLSPQYSSLQGNLLYIVDYTRLNYADVSTFCNHFLGYPVSYLQDAGPDFYVGQWHKADFKVYNEQIIPQIFRYLETHPDVNPSDLLISLNYRIRDKKGNYTIIKQKSAFLKTSPGGIPLAAVGIVSNDASFRPNNHITFSLEKLARPGSDEGNEEIISAVYYPDEKESILTKREIEILKLICEGHNSQEIAQRLNNSIHTINNHRKNILQKTNAKNVIEYITYAIRHHLL